MPSSVDWLREYPDPKEEKAKLDKQMVEWYGHLVPNGVLPQPPKPKRDAYTMTYVKYFRGLAPADSGTQKGWRPAMGGLPSYQQMLDPTAVDTPEPQIYEQEGSCLSRKYLAAQAANAAYEDAKAHLQREGITVTCDRVSRRDRLLRKIESSHAK